MAIFQTCYPISLFSGDNNIFIQWGPDGIGEARGGEDEENVEQEAANVSDISQGLRLLASLAKELRLLATLAKDPEMDQNVQLEKIIRHDRLEASNGSFNGAWFDTYSWVEYSVEN
ncbi:hypothetical protein KUCAC02_011080 [Chaenocephalus aceratus]|uniref:Uncharacterized protein n=1 Tax=Chaenocephalus aceratus TaxID=36190 RepID=A0ACB9WW97_CHAAC|nr:hypothetical protein KUCAC02_011080 [Chaenocephalus aceratus]